MAAGGLARAAGLWVAARSPPAPTYLLLAAWAASEPGLPTYSTPWFTDNSLPTRQVHRTLAILPVGAKVSADVAVFTPHVAANSREKVTHGGRCRSWPNGNIALAVTSVGASG